MRKQQEAHTADRAHNRWPTAEANSSKHQQSKQETDTADIAHNRRQTPEISRNEDRRLAAEGNSSRHLIAVVSKRQTQQTEHTTDGQQQKTQQSEQTTDGQTEHTTDGRQQK